MSLPLEILLPILPGYDARAYVELGTLVKQLGDAGVWVPETAGPDCVTLLAALAMRTAHVRLGSGILPIYVRSPVVLAETAVSLAQHSSLRNKKGWNHGK